MNDEKEAIAGFNAGYIIEQRNPTLAKQLKEAISEVEEDFFQGFVAGSDEFGKERSRTRALDKLREDLSRSTDSSKGREIKKKGPDKDR